MRRQPSRSTQSASDATAADAEIATCVSSMQPSNVRKPSCLARASIRAAGPTPPHLASFTLTPATTPTRPSRSSIVTALSSATIGSSERSWSHASWSSRWRGNGCSINSTPSRTSSGTSLAPWSGSQPVFASTRNGWFRLPIIQPPMAATHKALTKNKAFQTWREPDCVGNNPRRPRPEPDSGAVWSGSLGLPASTRRRRGPVERRHCRNDRL